MNREIKAIVMGHGAVSNNIATIAIINSLPEDKIEYPTESIKEVAITVRPIHIESLFMPKRKKNDEHPLHALRIKQSQRRRK